MAQYVEKFFFKDGLYDEANILLSQQAQAVEDGKNFIIQSGNAKSSDYYSRGAGASFAIGWGAAAPKSYYGTETNPEPGSYASGVSAALPIFRIKKNNGVGVVPDLIKLPVKTGASAASLGMYCYMLDDDRNVLATTTVKNLGASSESEKSFQLYTSPFYGLYKNYYLAFGVTGVSLAEFWGEDGVRFYSRNSDNCYPPSTDVFGNGSFVASLSATVEVGSTGSVHLSLGSPTKISPVKHVVNQDYYFDDVWFILNYDNLSCVPLLGSNKFNDGWFVEKLPGAPPYTMENIIMNDRDELLIAGPSLHPHLITGASNSWNASPATFAFQNSVIGDYTGASVWPSYMMEFKNRLLLFNVNVGQSLAAGVTTQRYPRSILPSGGFTPYLFDWNDEILIDTKNSLVGGVEYKGYAFVFTNSEIFYFTFDSAGNATAPETVTNSGGILNAEACCVSTEHIYYANNSGAYRLDGIIPRKISTPISDKWFNYTKEIKVLYDTVKNEVLFTENNVSSGTSGGTYIYNIDTQTWSFLEIPIISFNSPTPLSSDTLDSFYLTLLGGIFRRPVSRGNTTDIDAYTPELYEFYGYTGEMQLRKKCVLSADFSKKADPTWVHVQTKATPSASQGYKITTYWEGSPSINFQQTEQFLTEVNADYLYNVESHKFTVPGQGNILNVILERLPDTHGSKPIEFQSLQVEYDLVDAEV